MDHRWAVSVLIAMACAGRAPSPTTPLIDPLTGELPLNFRSLDDAIANGYQRLGASDMLRDVNPFVGEHWHYPPYLRPRSLDSIRPAYVMYYPTANGEDRLVGLAYGVLQRLGEPPPDLHAEDGGRWHLHVPCSDIPGVVATLTSSAEQCLALGGEPGTQQIAMLHQWPSGSNPLGTFAHDNPAIPFLLLGLIPPDSQTLVDPVAGREQRALALALSAVLGATPRSGSFVHRTAPDSFHDQLRHRREILAAHVRLLRRAEADRDRATYATVSAEVIEIGEEIQGWYLEYAETPQLREILASWFEHTLSGRFPHPPNHRDHNN